MMEAADAMIYLSVSALKGMIPDREKIVDISLDDLYQLCQRHSLTALVSYALESIGVNDKRFQDRKWMSVRKNLMMDAERNKLFAFLDDKKIWYMPLKGILLKDMYPKEGMRQMADNDIWFDRRYQQEVCAWFQENKYQVKAVGRSNHDVYLKEPVYNFEMHTELYGTDYNAPLREYYQNMEKRLLAKEGNSFCRYFSDEDFYVYMMSHAYKHYSGSGTGLRLLMDLYVWLEKKEEILNWQYIEGELEKLEIAAFELVCRNLMKHVFELNGENLREGLSEEERVRMAYFMGSGTYGTLQNQVKHRMEKYAGESMGGAKWRYCFRRLFPEGDFLMKNYAGGVKWLIPFGWFRRIVRALIVHPLRIWREIQYVLKNKN